MENQFFRCTQRAITQRRVITLGPIFIKMVLNRAQGLKEKSQEVSARKNNNQQRYNKKCRRGGGFRPPALLGLKYPCAKVSPNLFFQKCKQQYWDILNEVKTPWVLVGASNSGHSMITYLLRQLTKVTFCDLCLTFDP